MLSVRALTQRYGARVALDDLNFTLERGTFTALLGPNGAGKSTLFQVLAGLFAADAGDVTIAGRSMAGEARHALAQMGLVFQQQSLDLDLTVARNLQFHADLQGLPRATAALRIADGARRFGLSDELGRRVRELSGGTRRRIELMRALLHSPSVLLMDEPTVGLDPKSRRELLAQVRDDVARRGLTVLWATHLVGEAEAADRVLVLHRGRLIADGAPADVAESLGGPGLEEAFLHATA